MIIGIKHLQKEIVALEERLLALVKQDQQHQLTLLKSILGMGVKTALFLIVVTNGFKKFETASQLSSYVGVTPKFVNQEAVLEDAVE